jgi:hypothetical protein
MLQCALKAQRPVAFFINGHGDCFINLPALRALTHLFEGRLTLACKRTSDLFCFDDLEVGNRVALKVWGSPECGWQFDPAEALAGIGPCDLFLSLVPWYSPQLNGLLEELRPSLSVGFFGHYGHPLKLDYGKHSADLAFDIPRALQPDCRLEDFAAPLRYSEPQRAFVREIRAMLKPGQKILTLHADTLADKMWSDERWAAVLDEFLEAHREFVALLVGGGTYGDRQRIDAGRHTDRVIPCYGLSLAASCCLVAESDLFVGVDSCMLHVADLGRVPGVGLFGPTSAMEFGFRLGPHIMIQADGSTASIGVRQVVSALNQLAAAPTQTALWQAG